LGLVCARAHARRLTGKTRACKARAGQTAHVARPNGSLAPARGRWVGSRCESPNGTARAATPPSVRSTCASGASRDARVRECASRDARVRECASARVRSRVREYASARVRECAVLVVGSLVLVRCKNQARGAQPPLLPALAGSQGLLFVHYGPPLRRRIVAVALEQRELGSLRGFASGALRGSALRAA
jgi:hypothetical protein